MAAQIIELKARQSGAEQPVMALIRLAELRRAWNTENPQATLEQQLEAHARIAKELGL